VCISEFSPTFCKEGQEEEKRSSQKICNEGLKKVVKNFFCREGQKKCFFIRLFGFSFWRFMWSPMSKRLPTPAINLCQHFFNINYNVFTMIIFCESNHYNRYSLSAFKNTHVKFMKTTTT